jgi:hypothetical protein
MPERALSATLNEKFPLPLPATPVKVSALATAVVSPEVVPVQVIDVGVVTVAVPSTGAMFPVKEIAVPLLGITNGLLHIGVKLVLWKTKFTFAVTWLVEQFLASELIQ